MTNEQMARCFNEWMRRFIDEPARFEHEFEVVGEFLKESGGGLTPSYGEQCSAYMEQLGRELVS